MLTKFGLDHELLYKYERAAQNTFDKNFVSREIVMKNAEEATLCKENKELLSRFFDFADDDLKQYIWLYYYIQYRTDEDFKDNIWRLDEIPKPSEAEEKFPGCINAVTYLLAAEHLKQWIKEHNMPDEMIKEYYNKYRNFVKSNLITHKTYALCRLSAFLYGYSKPFILQIGRLVYQLTFFKDYAEMYESTDGRRIFAALPNYTYNQKGLQDSEGFVPHYHKTKELLNAHIFKEDGTLSLEQTIIDLKEYSLIYKPGDIVATIHIPAEGGKLTKEVVKESIAMAQEVFEKHIQPIQGIVCRTWFLDPGLRGEVIKMGSNMANFAEIFDVICGPDNDNHSIFEHVFKTYRRPLNELIPENGFQERILKRAQRGEKIYWSYGVLKKDYLK